VYNDDCLERAAKEERGQEGGNKERRIPAATTQRYSLLPNPNDGRMQVLQAAQDERPVSIKVYNAIGSVVYETSRIFESGISTFDLGHLAPGIYHMVLRDSAAEGGTLKFVKK
jgi:hypothetical protein